jgi:1,4-alpha-glucan branching enzyme
MVVLNNTPAPRHGYRLGADGGTWELLANSDDVGYGGSGMAAPSPLTADGEPTHGFDASVIVDLPPLAVLVYRRRAD